MIRAARDVVDTERHDTAQPTPEAATARDDDVVVPRVDRARELRLRSLAAGSPVAEHVHARVVRDDLVCHDIIVQEN